MTATRTCAHCGETIPESDGDAYGELCANCADKGEMQDNRYVPYEKCKRCDHLFIAFQSDRPTRRALLWDGKLWRMYAYLEGMSYGPYCRYCAMDLVNEWNHPETRATTRAPRTYTAAEVSATVNKAADACENSDGAGRGSGYPCTCGYVFAAMWEREDHWNITRDGDAHGLPLGSPR